MKNPSLALLAVLACFWARAALAADPPAADGQAFALAAAGGQNQGEPGAARAGTATTPEAQKAPRHRHTWRALLEDGVLITASTLDYWGSYGHFTVDWQFTWRTFGQKFFTAQSPKFDSNAFWYNWSHAFSGGAYYSMARANGLGSGWSTLFSFGLSAFWESLSEWRELISTNDMIMTSFGGPAIGEAFYQMSSYFSHRPGIVNRAAEFIFNPALAVNNWFDRGSGPAWNSGHDASWHRFSLYTGLKEDKVTPAGTTAVNRSGTSYRQFNFGLDMETDTAPGYGEAGKSRAFVSDTLSSQLLLDFSQSSEGLEEFHIRTGSVLMGWVWQALREGQDGSLRGWYKSLGLGMVFDTYKKRSVAWYDSNNEVESGGQATVGDARFDRPTPTRFTDKMSTMSPVGAVFRLSRLGPRLHLRWTAEAYGDFGMINSLAYNRYTENHDVSGVKTTLLDWGYYYAFGTTLASSLAVDWGQWRFQGGGSCQFYGSIQGQDRYQYMGLVTDDFKLHDSRVAWRFYLGYRLSRTPFELGLAAEGIERRGRILEVSDRYTEYRYFYQLRFLF